mgnify:FL=1
MMGDMDMKTSYYINEIMRRAKQEAQTTGRDVEITTGKVMMWFNVSMTSAYGITSALRSYLGVPTKGPVILTLEDLGVQPKKEGEATQS